MLFRTALLYIFICGFSSISDLELSINFNISNTTTNTTTKHNNIKNPNVGFAIAYINTPIANPNIYTHPTPIISIHVSTGRRDNHGLGKQKHPTKNILPKIYKLERLIR